MIVSTLSALLSLLPLIPNLTYQVAEHVSRPVLSHLVSSTHTGLKGGSTTIVVAPVNHNSRGNTDCHSNAPRNNKHYTMESTHK